MIRSQFGLLNSSVTEMDPSTKVEVLRACCCVAGADGECSESEMALLQRMAKEIGVGQASLRAMIDRGVSDPAFYQQHFKILKADPSQALAILFQVAAADGTLPDAEVAVLNGLAENLDVPQEIFEEVKAAAQKSLKRSN